MLFVISLLSSWNHLNLSKHPSLYSALYHLSSISFIFPSYQKGPSCKMVSGSFVSTLDDIVVQNDHDHLMTILMVIWWWWWWYCKTIQTILFGISLFSSWTHLNLNLSTHPSLYSALVPSFNIFHLPLLSKGTRRRYGVGLFCFYFSIDDTVIHIDNIFLMCFAVIIFSLSCQTWSSDDYVDRHLMIMLWVLLFAVLCWDCSS